MQASMAWGCVTSSFNSPCRPRSHDQWRDIYLRENSLQIYNLQRLVLDNCDLTSIAQLLETLSICKSLKRLGLYHLWIVGVHFDSAIGVNSPPPSSLRFVSIHCPVGFNKMMEWLVWGEQVPVIETLELSHVSIHTSRAIGHSLQRLGPSLKNLELQFAPNRSLQSTISNLTVLKSALLTFVPRCVFSRCGSNLQHQS